MDCQEFEVGDRVVWNGAKEAIYEVVKISGGHATISLLEYQLEKGKPRPNARRRVPFWQIKLLDARFNDQQESKSLGEFSRSDSVIVTNCPLVIKCHLHNSIFAQGSAQVSLLLGLSLEDSTLLDYANLSPSQSMDISETFCSCDTHTFPSSTMLGSEDTGNCGRGDRQTLSQLLPLAHPSLLKESAKEQMTQGIAFQQSQTRSPSFSQSSSSLKMSQGCSPAPPDQEKQLVHISEICSVPLTAWGTMQSGFVCPAPTLARPGLEKDCCWLPRPGALSNNSNNSRPPGTSKFEGKCKELGLLQKTQVANPEFLEEAFGLPIGWTDPLELRAATQLLGSDDRHLEIALTQDWQPSPLGASSTSTALPKVGARVKILKVRTRNLNHWVGHEAEVIGIDENKIFVATGTGKEKKHLTLRAGWYEVLRLPQSESFTPTQFANNDPTIQKTFRERQSEELQTMSRSDGATIDQNPDALLPTDIGNRAINFSVMKYHNSTEVIPSSDQKLLAGMSLSVKESNPPVPYNPSDSAKAVKAQAEVLEELTYDEERDRHHLERKVESAFREAAMALKELRDRRLYRSTHKTFEEYCRERFGFNRSRSYQLIDAATVVENLEKCPQFVDILPTNEAQCRPLLNLNLEDQRAVWSAIVESGQRPTGTSVKQKVAQLEAQGIVERLKAKPIVSAKEYCQVGDIFTLVRLEGKERKYNGCWAIATEPRDFTVIVDVHDTTLTVKPENLNKIDSPEAHRQLPQILQRIRRVRQVPGFRDRAAYTMLEHLGKQTYLTPLEDKLLQVIEQEYGVEDVNSEIGS